MQDGRQRLARVFARQFQAEVQPAVWFKGLGFLRYRRFLNPKP